MTEQEVLHPLVILDALSERLSTYSVRRGEKDLYEEDSKR